MADEAQRSSGSAAADWAQVVRARLDGRLLFLLSVGLVFMTLAGMQLVDPWIDIASFLFMLGFLSWRFFSNYFAHPPYPQRDPRMAEGLDVYIPPLSAAPAQTKGSH